jgi:hypothetical protein
MQQEGWVGWHQASVVLVGKQGHIERVLAVGECVEVQQGSTWQVVRVANGGYRGWYYVLPDGQRARFAVGMCLRVRCDSRHEGPGSGVLARMGV